MKKIHKIGGFAGFNILILLALISTVFPNSAQAALPAGFEVEKVVGGLNLPAAMQFTTDGRIFIAEKAGGVRVVKNGVLLPTPVITLTDVNSYGDRGLIGMALDPNFKTNGFIYLLYTYENTPGADVAGMKTARIVRITVTGDVSDESTKVVILGSVGGSAATPSCENFAVTADCIASDSPSHSGGALRFGPDGKLYVTLGDGAHFDYVDIRSLRAQNLDSLAGKVLRINTDGTGVVGNPYYTGNPNDNRSKVYASGVRNAFRMNFRPGNNTLYAGDVGWNNWEEVDKIVAGANYGWPCREGAAPTVGQTCTVVNYTDPLYTYGHDANGAGSVVVGDFPTAYPAAYNSSLFIGDYAQNWIKRVVVDANDNFVSVQNFMMAADGAMGPVALDRGPDGNIYYIAIYAGELRRILYTTGNRQPIAQISASVTNGLAPLAVNFSAAASTDPDGNPLTYKWDFGDNASSTAVAPSHTYAANGTYIAAVTVFDGQGGQNTKSVTITVGNRAPTAVILAPTSGSLYHVGDTITLNGNGTDPEDGTITAASKLTWTIILHHNTHIHILQTLTGTNPSFVAPDHQATDIYTEVQLTVTDAGGLTNTKSVNIYLNNNTNTTGNLIENPSLEDAVPGAPDTPQFWQRGGYGVNGAVYTYPVTGRDGLKAAKVSMATYTDGDVKWFHNPVSVTGNTVYTFSGYYFSTAPGFVTLQVGDTNGGRTYIDQGTLPVNAGWTHIEKTFTTPGYATTISVILAITGVGELTIDDFSLTSGTSTPDTTVPTVSITTPVNNATASGTIAISAQAADNVAVSNVKFYLDSAFLFTSINAPYGFNWDSRSVADGNHSLLAVAKDAAGNSATSTAVTVKVQNTSTSTPAVNLISNPSVETANGAVPLDWLSGKWGTNTTTFTYPVTGQDGAKAVRVQTTAYTSGDTKWYFKDVNVTPGIQYTFSEYYQANVTTSVIAQYTLTTGAVSYVTLAATVPTATAWTKLTYTLTPPTNAKSVTVFHILSKVGILTTDNYSILGPGGTPPADTTAPTVTLTSPTSGQNTSGTIQLTATATDASGVAGVKFLIDNVLFGAEDTTSPYSLDLDTTARTNGSHTAIAVARDTVGNIATTTAVTFNIQNTTGTTTPGTNLISNPSAETAAGALPQDWFQGGWGTNTTTFTYPVTGQDGAKAMRVQTTAYTSGDAKWYFKDVNVTPGTQYTFSNYYQATVPTSLIAQYTLTTGALSYVTLAATVPTAAAWTKLTYTLTPPTNAKSVTVFHILSAVGTLTTDNYSILGPGGTSTPDTTVPSVAFLTPNNNQTVSGSISVSATASDASGIAGVKFFLDSTLFGSEDVAAPYGFTLDTTVLANGNHTLTATARDTAGNTANATPITINVQNTTGTTSPNLILNGSLETANGANPLGWSQAGWGTNTTNYIYPSVGRDGGKAAGVQVTAYTDGDIKWAPDAIVLQHGKVYTFSAWYKSSTILDVIGQYKLADGTFFYFGVIKELPPTTTWTYFTASFTPPDNANEFRPFPLISAVGTLDIDDVSLVISGNGTSTNDLSNPIVQITSPLPNATVSGMVNIVASSTDNIGVTGVMFAIDGTPKTGLITPAPYTYAWDTTLYTNGAHILKATTHDAAGNNTTDTISVTVNNTAATSTPQNLIVNPSLETANGANPANWEQDKWGTNTTTFTYPIAGYNSTNGAKVAMTAYTSGDAKWVHEHVAVTPGASYTLSDYYISTVATSVVLEYISTTDTYSYVYVGSVPVAAAWTKYQATFTAPANTKSVSVLHVLDKVGSLSVDQFSLIKN